MARIVMDPEQQRLELLNIILAWDGAIKFNPNLKPVLERDTLVQLLSYLTADLPGLLRLDPKERDGETAKTEKAKADESTPKYEGFLSFLMFLSACEMMAAPFAFIWGLICTEWILSLALVVFLLFLGAKFVLMSARKTAARWLGVFNYSWILTYAAYRIDAHDQGYQMGPAGLLLVKILAVWSGVMLLVYLLYLRFAKSMREAPEGED